MLNKATIILLSICSFILSSCTTTQGPVLSSSITLKPGWPALKISAKKAISSPAVWGNLLAVSLLQIDNLDQQLSDQLRENTPLFGSSTRAAERSDDFRDLSELAYVSTALLAPGPDSTGDWIAAKTKLLGSEWLGVKTARSVTSGLKSLTDRERPNQLNTRSFPSGHTTTTASQVEMAKLNINYLPLHRDSQIIFQQSLNGLNALTAWARVEAGMHYPTDVLAGWAVGNFMAQLASTFIDPKQQWSIIPQEIKSGAGLQLVILY